MGRESKIAWTHHTFSPWWGCQRVSPGCQHCYAESFAKRVGHRVWGPESPRRFFSEKHWREPIKWNARALRAEERQRVFCSSMADVFEDRPDLVSWRLKLWQLIGETPSLDWLLLTKRPENIMRLVPERWRPLFPRNVWIGTTAENQEYAELRIPELLKIPAIVRFVSAEPLLGPLDLRPYLAQQASARCVDWVIVGGESGYGARDFYVSWARSIRDQCAEFGTAFFFKQLGSSPIAETTEGQTRLRLVHRDGKDPIEFPIDLQVMQYPKAA